VARDEGLEVSDYEEAMASSAWVKKLLARASGHRKQNQVITNFCHFEQAACFVGSVGHILFSDCWLCGDVH
jgi:hypothetical protein